MCGLKLGIRESISKIDEWLNASNVEVEVWTRIKIKSKAKRSIII